MKAPSLFPWIAVVLLLVAPTVLCAQSPEAHTRIADRYYERMAYAQARAEYRLAADLGATNEHVVKRLAQSSMKLGDTREAERWYAQVVKFLNREPQDLYKYAQALKSNGKYEEAEKWMDRYLAMARKEGEPKVSNIVDFSRKFMSDMDRFTVAPVSVNSSMDDMAAAWNGSDQVVFASNRDSAVGIQWRSAWNDKPFLDLYQAQRQPSGDLVDARPIGGNVNSKLHEGPACVAPDGSLWYTRTNATKGKDGVYRLSIHHAQPDGAGRWKGSDPFLYNNPECSVGHPAISADGKYLFFVSDMPGGYGGTDIYVCQAQGGQWGEPRNLGPGVNTAHNELFPYMAHDGTLYFSSSGLPGLGGLDVFATSRNSQGEFAFAINVGAPINGPKDDFAFIIDKDNKHGYFTSNRPGGQGGDDIYAFTMHAPLEQHYLCTGTVIDDDVAEPMADVEVELLDMAGDVLESGRTNEEGRYSFPVRENMEYAVRARAHGRYDGVAHLSTEEIGKQQIIARDVHLVPDAGIWLRGVVGFAGQIGFANNVKVSVVNLTSFFSDVKYTGPGGDVLFRMQPNEQFEVVLEKEGYFSLSLPVSTLGVTRGVLDLGESKKVELEPIIAEVPIPMKYVRWSAEGDALAPTAKAELDLLADRILVNPTLYFEVAVNANTKLDGKKAQKLTADRAKVIQAYLQAKGVGKARMKVTGYGITRPTNPCGPGTSCTDEQHAENERVEYWVTPIDRN